MQNPMFPLSLITLSLLLLLPASGASAMLRVLKYQSLTEVHEQKICVFVQHEMNFKRENKGHPQNSREPIVCRLRITAEAGPQALASTAQAKRFTADAVRRFDFEKLEKVCTAYRSVLPKGYIVRAFSGLTSECATEEAGARVFPEYAKQKLSPAKGRSHKQS